MKWNLIRRDLEYLKNTIRKLYGDLPVVEIITNSNLVNEFENFEKQFRGLMNELYPLR